MRVAIFFFAALILSGALQALQMPSTPEHRVNDYAGILSQQDKASLEARLKQIEENTSNQIVIAMFPKSEGEDIDDFANRLFEKWHLGQKKNNNGVLLIAFLEDRRVRIEVGYGLEGVLTDALCSEIIRDEIVPSFREGQYAKGLSAAVDAMDRATRGEYKGKGPAPDQTDTYQIIIFILFLLLIIWLSRRRRNSGIYLPGPRYRRAGLPWIFFPREGWSNRSSRGSGWGGGGGFSGGGGLSGGGGASGSW